MAGIKPLDDIYAIELDVDRGHVRGHGRAHECGQGRRWKERAASI